MCSSDLCGGGRLGGLAGGGGGILGGLTNLITGLAGGFLGATATGEAKGGRGGHGDQGAANNADLTHERSFGRCSLLEGLATAATIVGVL